MSDVPSQGTRAETASSAGVAGASVTCAVADGIAEIALQAGALNLVTKALLRGLNATLKALVEREDIRCVILHGGTARAFCAGSDIREFDQLREDASEHKILFEDMVLRNLARLAAPTIAAMDGPALGGGFELALACDLRVCKRGVKVGLTESTLGGLAGSGAVRLTRLIGPGRAKELLFTAATIPAEQALEWGMVNRVVEDGSALDAARDMARQIASRGPVSNRLAKELVDAAQDMPIDAALSASTIAQQRIFDTQDLHEGAAAFFAKRPPIFRGT